MSAAPPPPSGQAPDGPPEETWRPVRLGPLPEPADDAAAAALTRAFQTDVDTLHASDRLGDVRDRVRYQRRRGLGQLAAAAVAVAAVVVTAGVLQQRGPTAPVAGPDRGSPSTAAMASAPSRPVDPYLLPVYYLGRDGDRWALYREFHRRRPTDGRPVTPPLDAALREATTPASVQDRDLSAPWSAAAARAAISLTDGVVTVDLPAAEAQPRGRTPEQARLAVQQLVWTASAVQQDGGLGVRLLIAGRPGLLFGAEPVGEVVRRTSPSYEVLGSVWVHAPDEGQQVVSPVTVRGSACTFEANVSWQLLQDGTVLRSGHVTADSGCPTRGAWSVALDQLAPGRYTFRAYEPPASGSGPDRADTRSFTVR